MTHYITHIRDILGNNYLGIKIPKGYISKYLEDMKDILAEDEYKDYIKYKNQRDNGEYHITVINVIDYNKLTKEMGVDNFVNSLDVVMKYPIDDLKLKGIGTAKRNDNRTFFVVCQSDKLEAVRERYSLKGIDYHITLGFKYKDVFGVSKNQVIEKKSNFLKLISNKYYNDKNWNFIKRISNFDLEKDEELVPVDISDTMIKFKYKGYFIYVGVIGIDELRILSQYTIDKESPRMSQTKIEKFINKNKDYDI